MARQPEQPVDGHRGLSGTGLWRGRIHRERGPSAAEIADNLLKAEVIKSTAAFTSVVNANSTTLYPGTFTLKKHMAASKVIDVLSDTNQAAGFLEVRPGERATDVFANAAKLSGIAQSEFDTIIKNKGKDILPNEAGGSFEGWLEPEPTTSRA